MKAPIAISLSLLAMVAVAGVSSDRLGGAENVAASTKPADTAKAPKAPKTGKTGKTEVEPLNDEFRVPQSKRPVLSRGPSLRCWQYGRLILDEPVSEVPASLAGSGHRFVGRGGSLQLLDMHNSSCLIK